MEVLYEEWEVAPRLPRPALQPPQGQQQQPQQQQAGGAQQQQQPQQQAPGQPGGQQQPQPQGQQQQQQQGRPGVGTPTSGLQQQTGLGPAAGPPPGMVAASNAAPRV